jgi:hypothetical protein
MTRNWMRKLALPGLAAMLAVTACEKQVTGPEMEVSPAAPAFAKGGNGNGQGHGQKKGHANGPKVRDRRTGRAYGLVTGHLPAGEVKAERVIGPAGGWVGVSGHYIYVSPGAVAQPTEFRMQQFKQFLGQDSTVIVGVSLKAETKGGKDIGAAGFAAPVYLYLDASWADELDADNTTVLWLKSANDAEPVAEVTRNGKWYVATLEHFSDYGLGDPGIVGRTIGTVGSIAGGLLSGLY